MEFTSYDKDFAKENELVLNVIINQCLKTLINLGANAITIGKETISKHPNILEEDERKTSEREAEERRKFVASKGAISDSYKEEVEREAREEIKKKRIPEAFSEAEGYIRIAHNLYVNFDSTIPNGCPVTVFWGENPDDEPFLEKTARIATEDEEMRTKLRHTMMCKMIGYSYKYWDMIKGKNLDFLTNHFSVLFPDGDFSDKLGIIYGSNDEKKNYVSEEDLNVIWRYLHGVIKLCIKYMYYTDRQFFNVDYISPEIPGGKVDVDYHTDIEKWGVKLEVRTDNLEMWNKIN